MLQKLSNKREKHSFLFFLTLFSLFIHFMLLESFDFFVKEDQIDYVEIEILSDTVQKKIPNTQTVKQTDAKKVVQSIQKQNKLITKEIQKKKYIKPKVNLHVLTSKKIIVPKSQSALDHGKILTAPKILEKEQKVTIKNQNIKKTVQEKKIQSKRDILKPEILNKNLKSTIQPVIQNKESLTQVNTKEKRQSSQQLHDQLQITINDRKVVFFPEKKILNLKNNNQSIRFKFQVKPNGTVFNIIPLNKGSFKFEKISADYLSQIRFEKIANNQIQNGQVEFHINKNIN